MRNTLLAAALAACVGLAYGAGVPGQGTWETTLKPRDIDGNGVVDAFYDTDLDLTWLRDTALLGHAYYAMDARPFSLAFSFGGYDDWRLPALDQSICGGNFDIYYCGPLLDAHPESSALGHLYYVTLGNSRLNLTNTGDFIGMENATAFVTFNYLGGDPHQGPWIFLDGAHWGDECGCPIYDAMLVRRGDVAAVPELPAVLLGSLGAAALFGWRRRSS